MTTAEMQLPEWMWAFVTARPVTAAPVPPKFVEWTARGQRVPVAGHRLFARVEGDGPTTTFLHGFPTSSLDWVHVRNRLPDDRRRLYVDHLGFGASDKPRPYQYSFAEQVDLLLGLWRHFHIERTVLVVHDYSVSIAQEILARHVDGTWRGPDIAAVVFLNGGLFAARYTPLRIQKLLQHRVTGPLLAPFVSYRVFRRSMRRIHHPGHEPEAAFLREQWAAVVQQHGKRVYPHLSAYHEERALFDARWRTAMEQTDVPMVFLWGLADPISGAMADEVPNVAPQASVVAWSDVGHYPMVEVPDRIAAAVSAIERRAVPVKPLRV